MSPKFLRSPSFWGLDNIRLCLHFWIIFIFHKCSTACPSKKIWVWRSSAKLLPCWLKTSSWIRVYYPIRYLAKITRNTHSKTNHKQTNINLHIGPVLNLLALDKKCPNDHRESIWFFIDWISGFLIEREDFGRIMQLPGLFDK